MGSIREWWDRSRAAAAERSSADRIAVRANRTSVLALVVSVAAAVLAWQQADAAREANDIAVKEKATHVYIQRAGAPGAQGFEVVNRGQVQAVNVTYTYQIAGIASPQPVSVGMVPSCSAVALTLPDGTDRLPGFAPVTLHFRDPNGTDWENPLKGGITRDPNPPIAADPTATSGTVTRLDGCS